MGVNPSNAQSPSGWRLKMLYDGRCHICSREVHWLRRRAQRKQAPLAFEDITAADFDPTRYGLTHEQVHRQMYGVLSNGSLVSGLAAFRRAYHQVGLGWLLAWTRWPILRPLSEVGYAAFARLRPHLPRRPTGEADRCAAP